MTEKHEEIFNRWLLNRGGRDDLSWLSSEAARTLRDFKTSLNTSLANAPQELRSARRDSQIHLDYIAGNSQQPLSFTDRAGFLFIGLPTKFILGIGDRFGGVSQSAHVTDLLGINTPETPLNTLQAILFFLLFNFIVCHEYTHLLHGHHGRRPDSSYDLEDDNIVSQVWECAADRNAANIVLTNLFRDHGEMWLSQPMLRDARLEKQTLLICLFIVAVCSYFYLRPPPTTLCVEDLRSKTYPHPWFRVGRIMDMVVSWCRQRRPGLESAVTHRLFVDLVQETVKTSNAGVSPRHFERDPFWDTPEVIAYQNQLLTGIDEYWEKIKNG